MTGAVTVFIPLTRPQVNRLAVGEPAARSTGYADTAGLRRAYELGPTQEEQAGHVALGHAGVAALLLTAPRLVLAAEVAPSQVHAGDDAFGTVEVLDLAWSQVQALFADDPAGPAELEQARHWASGRGVDELVSDSRIVDLVESCDLLWFSPQELNQLPF